MVEMNTETPFKLDPQEKAEWVAALRSGKYPQGHRRLRGETGFCCLGVKAAITPGVTWNEQYGGDFWLCAWPGVEGSLGDLRSYIPFTVIPEHIQYELSDMNDGITTVGGHVKAPLTFAQIADWIEAIL